MPVAADGFQVSPDEEIARIHATVDRDAARLELIHRDRLRCGRGCADCCVDGITVGVAEATRIRRAYPDVLRSAPAPAGQCAFLDADLACRIYDVRPYVCRTQGLPLRWFGGDPVAEYRDICPLNDDGPSLTTLDPETCWLIGPTEASLARLSGAHDRVPLRDLFE